MRPDDDMRLGGLLKEAGFRQDVAYGTGSVSVEWHRHDVGALQRPGADSREKLLDLEILRSSVTISLVPEPRRLRGLAHRLC
jgi:hypothetical protein